LHGHGLGVPALGRAQDRVGRAGLDAADSVYGDRVIGHLPDDAEIVGDEQAVMVLLIPGWE
jgi:hypothetical protein